MKKTSVLFLPFVLLNKWNQVRIRCKGNHVKTWINGQLSGDFKDDKHKHGVIGLQHNSKEGVYCLRNLRIKEI